MSEPQKIPHWYAVRAAPGSQQAQREYVVEHTNSRKGYRIVPSLNPGMSAIEKSLSDAGFDCYMPAERRLIRDRRRSYIWKSKRFALMVGYVFVREPDFGRLRDVPGVSYIVRDASGKPLPLSILDMLTIRRIEAKGDARFDADRKHARWKLRKEVKENPALQKIVDTLDKAGEFTVPLGVDPLPA